MLCDSQAQPDKALDIGVAAGTRVHSQALFFGVPALVSVVFEPLGNALGVEGVICVGQARGLCHTVVG